MALVLPGRGFRTHRSGEGIIVPPAEHFSKGVTFMHPLKTVFSGRQGQRGVFSVCTANPIVLLAAMLHAKRNGYVIVIEATANQVNQFGGYTGMTPADYMSLAEGIRKSAGLPAEQVVFGGDHLGPLTWRELRSPEAMENAAALVRAYTRAGFTKIHLDTSMRMADDDPAAPLDVEVCARRGAALAKVVMEAYADLRRDKPDAQRPVLVIGSEVPIPGGSQRPESSVTPTAPEEFCRQYRVFKEAFTREGIPFEDVIAFVVQPGVEFGDDFVFQYDRQRAAGLCAALREVAPLVFEGHSTDYQTAESLSAMVEDGIRILKVGPSLTFGLREALFMLEECEAVMVSDKKARSGLQQAVLREMDADKKYWRSYYRGTAEEIAYKKLYSYSDRCRYYLPAAGITAAAERLLANAIHVPHALISQYFPRQYERVISGWLGDDGLSLILDRICDWLDVYAGACGISPQHPART